MRQTARTLFTAIAIAGATLAASVVLTGAHASEPAEFDNDSLKTWGEIESLAWPLQVAAADKCSDPSFHTGIELLTSPAQGFFIRNVSRGSPAYGLLKVDDRIVSINGKKAHRNASKAFEAWVGGEREELRASPDVQRWTVQRGDTELAVEVQPVKVCHLDIYYVQGAAPAILRRQNMAMFTPQLHQIAPEPWMIQAQIAHDLGHRLGQHEQQRTRTSRLTGFAGNVLGALGGPDLGGAAGHALNIRRAPAQEVAADRAGIDLAISIGLPEADLIQYWVDVLDQTSNASGLSSWLSAHPAHPTRIDALQERFKLIAKQAQPPEDEPAS